MEETVAAVVESTPAPVEAPATTTPEVSVPATSPERPTSMRAALEQVAAKRADKGTAATTAPPAPDGALPAKTPGPIPFDVHKTALENARIKASEEISNQWKDYDFARAVPAADLRELVMGIQETGGDPVAFLEWLSDKIAADPAASQRLNTVAAKRLAAARAKAAADVEPQPDIPIDDGQGGLAGYAYSAKRLAEHAAWQKRQFMAEVGQQIAPLKQSHDAALQAKADAEKQSKASEWSGGFGKELTGLPFFAEHKDAIGQDVFAQLQRLAADDPRGDDPAFLEAATLRAYHRIVSPKQEALISARISASNKQKAVAQTESPSRSAPTSGTRPRNPKELAKFLEAKAAERGR